MFTNNKKQTRGIGIKSLLATAVTAALIMTPTAKAVDGSSIVKGHVVAQAGNDLTGATITLKHKSKGLVYTITSNNDGDYLLRNVPVGTYDVTISKEGFEPLVEENVAVTIGQSIILWSWQGLVICGRFQHTPENISLFPNHPRRMGKRNWRC